MTLQNFIKNSRASKIKIVPNSLFSHIAETAFYRYFSPYPSKKNSGTKILFWGPLMLILCILINGCPWPGIPSIALLALFVVHWDSINWNFLLLLKKMWNRVFITMDIWFLFTVIWNKFCISDRVAPSSKVRMSETLDPQRCFTVFKSISIHIY